MPVALPTLVALTKGILHVTDPADAIEQSHFDKLGW
jgi:hypothetical protein